MSEPIWLVTLAMDDASFARMDALRRQHFPPERNKIPAHITLFHQLPGATRDRVASTLAHVAATTSCFTMTVSGLWMMGQGVAYTLDAPDAMKLHQSLREAFHEHLIKQDDRPLKPHITIQNKVTAEEAKQLHATLQRSFKPFPIHAVGFDLWHYLGGPWDYQMRIDFKPGV